MRGGEIEFGKLTREWKRLNVGGLRRELEWKTAEDNEENLIDLMRNLELNDPCLGNNSRGNQEVKMRWLQGEPSDEEKVMSNQLPLVSARMGRNCWRKRGASAKGRTFLHKGRAVAVVTQRLAG